MSFSILTLLMLLGLPIFIFCRWFIWRDRFKRLTQQISHLETKIEQLERQVTDVQGPPPTLERGVEALQTQSSTSRDSSVESPKAEQKPVRVMPPSPAEPARPADTRTTPSAGSFRISALHTPLYEKPDLSSKELKEIARGALVMVIEKEGGFLRVITDDDKIGYLPNWVPMSAVNIVARSASESLSPAPQKPLDQAPQVSKPLAQESEAGMARPEASADSKPSFNAQGPEEIAVLPTDPSSVASITSGVTTAPTEATRPQHHAAEHLKTDLNILDWETRIGTQWFNKIGIVVLVIGVSLFLGYSLRHMGPVGRVMTGVGTSLLLLVGGVFLERTRIYSLFAKPLIGGGWALLYFTAYAAHNLEAARIVEEPLIGLFLLGTVAAGMIFHSLKYRSEVVTGFAYFLGFLTVALSPLTGFTLVTAFILAGSLAVILKYLRWYSLALYGLAATYLNHFLWLNLRMGGPAGLGDSDSLWLAQGMLVLYWLLFVTFAFIAKPDNEKETRLDILTNSINTVAFLGLSSWQIGTLFPEKLYVLTGLSGCAYIVCGYLLHGRKKRELAIISASTAIALIAITFPLMPRSWPLSKDWLAVAWAAEAAIVAALGFGLKQILVRSQAYILLAFALAAILSINLFGQPAMSHGLRWLTVLPLLVYFYYLYAKLDRAWHRREISNGERDLGNILSFIASGLLALLFWRQFDLQWVGLSWLGAGLFLLEAGIRLQRKPLRTQGHLLAALTLGVTFILVLADLFGRREASIVSSTILGFYYIFWRVHRAANKKQIPEEENNLADLWSYGASGLLVLLLWKQANPDLLALAWLAAGLTLVEIGLRFQRVHLRIQGYGISVLALVAFFVINLYGVFDLQESRILSRWLTISPGIVGFYYLFWRLQQAGNLKKVLDEEQQLSALWAYAASALFAVLLWKELDAVAVALAWGFFALALFEIGTATKQPTLRFQGHMLAALAFGRLFLANFTAPGAIIGLSHRLITVMPIIAILYYVRLRVREDQVAGESLKFEGSLPQAYSYGAAMLLATLARFELGRSHAVIGWGLMALGFFMLGVLRKDRDFRIQSYAIAGLAFWRSWSTNFYLIGSYYGIPERIATTVPVIAAFYAAKLVALLKRGALPKPGMEEKPGLLVRIDAKPQVLFSLLGTLLITLLLYYEIQGNLLTMAWTVEGFVLLALGFLIRERTFRLSGILVLMVCLVKVFVIDLQGVETLYRIFSFIVLGIILLLVSFVYTKYRDVIKRYI